MTIGIDKIGFATSPYVLRLEDLATARDTDPEKLSKGLLLKEQSVAPVSYTHLVRPLNLNQLRMAISA